MSEIETTPTSPTETEGHNPPTGSQPGAEKKVVKPTSYHVLRRVPSAPAASPSQVEELWAVVAKNVEAQSAEAAKRKIAANLTSTGDDSVELVAVPSRSWQPQTAAVKTTHQLVLS